MPLSDFFTGAQRFAGQALGQAQQGYRQLDKSLGGWLPGGGTASPATRVIFPPQTFPERSQELERLTGVRARFVDPKKTPTLVNTIAPIFSKQWGRADYANPLLNEVGISNYQGGQTGKSREIEFHELGHLNPKDKQLYSYGGVLGRTLQGVSNQLGNPALLDYLTGVSLQRFDAPEEDRAERFAKQFEKIGNYEGTIRMTPSGNFEYGENLRRKGQELEQSALNRLANPFGIMSIVNRARAFPIQVELHQLEPQLKDLMQKQTSTEISPELLQLSKRHSELSEQLKSLGISDNQ